MVIALELCGITKRFSAGAGACIASADVLRGVSLCVAGGESLAIVGPAGAGKSTLLLCAAGLLTPEAGEARWFGAAERAAAARCAVYHHTLGSLHDIAQSNETRVHLVDLPHSPDAVSAAARWIERRCELGDAVLVTTRDEESAHHLADNVSVLRAGRLHPDSRVRSRVAEHAHG